MYLSSIQYYIYNKNYNPTRFDYLILGNISTKETISKSEFEKKR